MLDLIKQNYKGKKLYLLKNREEIIVEDDKVTVRRARRIQRFMSQPFFVAEQFTGYAGKYVKLEDTVRSFKEILDGKHDDLPEQAFLFVGTIEEAVEKAKQLQAA